jgi:DNA modification methylase
MAPRKAIYTAADEQALVDAGSKWNFHDADSRELLHALHPYPAKFIPQIPARAIELWSRPGDLIYDPFCGCGTTLLEAIRTGRSATGTDNNAVAILVSRAKTTRYSAATLRKARTLAAQVADGSVPMPPRPDLIPADKRIEYWYHPPVIARLSAIKGLILDQPPQLQLLMMAVFSAILVRVSLQDSDTRYARVSRDVSAEHVTKVFASRLLEGAELAARSSRAISGSAEVFQTDARSVPMIHAGSVKLIVTSPPYLNAYDYHKYHRQRINWIDGDVSFARDLEIGSHDEFTKPKATPDRYFLDMKACATEWVRVLRRRGRCLVVVGDAIVSGRPVPVADRFVADFESLGLRLEDRWIRALKPTSRAFNVKNSRITHEHLLLFGKR